MKGTGFFVSWRRKILISFLVFAVSGCVSHDAWLDMVDGYVGTPFEEHLDPPLGRPGLSGSFWSDGNFKPEERVFDKVISEGSGKRYYISWSRAGCAYSVLVDAKGIINSWRYESDDRSSCVVW